MTGRRDETRSQSQAGSHRSQERLSVRLSPEPEPGPDIPLCLSVRVQPVVAPLSSHHGERDPSLRGCGGITSTIDLSDQTWEQDCQDILSKIFLQATNFKTLKAAKICSLLWFCALLRVRGKIITPRVGMLDINNNSCILYMYV